MPDLHHPAPATSHPAGIRQAALLGTSALLPWGTLPLRSLDPMQREKYGYALELIAARTLTPERLQGVAPRRVHVDAERQDPIRREPAASRSAAAVTPGPVRAVCGPFALFASNSSLATGPPTRQPVPPTQPQVGPTQASGNANNANSPQGTRMPRAGPIGAAGPHAP